jgi:hypothetical protein
MMMLRSMLTTIDNPHSPFDNYGAWNAYDVSSGYHTASFLARIVIVSDQMSEVVYENVLGIYRKVQKEFDDDEQVTTF